MFQRNNLQPHSKRYELVSSKKPEPFRFWGWSRLSAKIVHFSPKIIISHRARHKQPIEIVKEIYKWRHLIENFFCKLQGYKAIVMRCEKTDRNFSSFINICAAVINAKWISTNPRCIVPLIDGIGLNWINVAHFGIFCKWIREVLAPWDFSIFERNYRHRWKLEDAPLTAHDCHSGSF